MQLNFLLCPRVKFKGSPQKERRPKKGRQNSANKIRKNNEKKTKRRVRRESLMKDFYIYLQLFSQ